MIIIILCSPEFPSLEKGGEHNKNTALSLQRQEEKKNFLDLTERGKPNDVAHRSIIQAVNCEYKHYSLSGIRSSGS